MPSLSTLAAGLAAFALAPSAAAHNVRAGTAHCDIDPRTGTFKNPKLCGANDWQEKYAHALSAGPEQFWLNYGSTPDSMVFGWATSDTSAPSQVQYGTTKGGPYPQSATGTATTYVYGPKYTSPLLHHTTVTGLAPNTTYYYQVGGSGTWSAEMSFISNSVGPTAFPFTFGLIADMGEGAAASSTVQHLVDSVPHTDALIFSGDIAYASGCESSGCTTWDAFQRLISPVTGLLPTSVNIGNHETYDVSAAGQVAVSALHRFAGMPADPTAEGAWYFGYRAGPAHVISVSSFYPGGFGESSKMTAWLQQELKTVDRTVTPWLIISLHAPWYNSNSAHQGDGEAMRQAYEPIFIAAGVNIIVSGHVHSMERSLPVNNNQLDPKGIVHLNFGDAGAGLYTTWLSQPKWSAFRSAEWGHAELTLVNSTHALYTWHRNADPEPTVGDQAYIVNTQA